MGCPIAVRTIKAKLHIGGWKSCSRCQRKYKALRRSRLNVDRCVGTAGDLIVSRMGGLKLKARWHTGARHNITGRSDSLTCVDDCGKGGGRDVDLHGATAGKERGHHAG